MMRILLSAAAMMLTVSAVPVGAQARAQTQANHYTTVRTTPSGTVVHGNPAARVKLVEWLSMTCSHCANFSNQSGAELDRRIRSGDTSLEYRHLILNPVDFAASMVARCGGAARFPGNARALFAAQPRWLERATAWLPANQAALEGQSTTRRLQLTARGVGLYELMRTRGYTPAQLDRCLADTAEQQRLSAMTTEGLKTVQATPSFAINGTLAPDARDWATLAPLLVAAGSR